MSERGKLRKLLMRVVTVIMIVLITGFSYVTALLLGMCTPGHVMKLLNGSGYYTAQAECIEERLAEITEKAGLSTEIYDGIFESEEIITITREYTANRIYGYTDELNKEAVKERLKANIIEMMEEEGKSKATLDTEALNIYLGQAASIYEQTVINGLTLNYSTFRSELSKAALAGISAILVSLGICIWFIYALTKMRRKTISYVIRALESSIILTAVPPIIALVMNVGEKLTYSPEYMKSFTESYIHGAILCCLLFSVVLAVFIAALSIISLRINRRKSK